MSLARLARLAPVALAAALLAAPAAADPSPAGQAWGAGGWRHDAGRDRVGRIYHYLRTNTDGSEPEHVRVFRRTAASIAVNKQVDACTNAAYVTAELDLSAGAALALVGGRLTREGTQDAFAYLDVGPDRLTAEVNLPDRKLADTADIPGGPLVMYDFDLSDLTVLAPHLTDPRKGFGFELGLFWPPDMPDFLQHRGRLEARFEREETRRDRPALRFAVTGAPFGDKAGTLWLDAAEGHVLEASFPLPNHDNYADFRLVLEKVEDSGEAGWTRLLMSHWEGCPAG